MRERGRILKIYHLLSCRAQFSFTLSVGAESESKLSRQHFQLNKAEE